ncbi:MAG: Spy/CpxP family protein refolding chaperone [Thermoguttaceae bacterium]
MTSKYSTLVMICFLAATFMATVVQGQGPPQRGRHHGGPPPMFGERGGPERPMMVLALLRNEKVRKDLDLTDKQFEKLRELAKDFREDARANFTACEDLNREDRRAKMQECVQKSQEKLDKQLGDILDGKQLQRLEQIKIQIAGPAALRMPKVVKALNISEEQQEKIKDVINEVRKTRREAMRDFRELSQQERYKLVTEMHEKAQQLRKETTDKLLEVLTKEQREQFDKLRGEDIGLTFADLMPRGHRGGRGGHHHRGGGGPGGPAGPGGPGEPPPL